jgi:hypothetical protein
MSIAFVQSTTDYASGVFTNPNTAGNFLVCAFRGTAAAIVSDTIGNTGWTKAVAVQQSDTNGTGIWYCLNCKGGANTVSVSAAASFVVVEYSGIALAAALDKTNSATGSGNPYASGSIGSLASANELIIGAVSNESTNNNTDTPTGGFSDVANSVGNVFLANLIISTLGTYSYGGSYSSSSNNWAAAVASFIAAIATFSISGNAGVAGALVSYSGTASGSVAAGAGGAYTIPNLANGSYVVTPSLAGYTFSPTSQSETVSGANITGVNFVATQIPIPPPSRFTFHEHANVTSSAVLWDVIDSGDGKTVGQIFWDNIVARAWSFNLMDGMPFIAAGSVDASDIQDFASALPAPTVTTIYDPTVPASARFNFSAVQTRSGQPFLKYLVNDGPSQAVGSIGSIIWDGVNDRFCWLQTNAASAISNAADVNCLVNFAASLALISPNEIQL